MVIYSQGLQNEVSRLYIMSNHVHLAFRTASDINAMEAGLVYRAEDYTYSSASDYAGIPGLLEGVIIVGI